MEFQSTPTHYSQVLEQGPFTMGVSSPLPASKFGQDNSHGPSTQADLTGARSLSHAPEQIGGVNTSDLEYMYAARVEMADMIGTYSPYCMQGNTLPINDLDATCPWIPEVEFQDNFALPAENPLVSGNISSLVGDSPAWPMGESKDSIYSGYTNQQAGGIPDTTEFSLPGVHEEDMTSHDLTQPDFISGNAADGTEINTSFTLQSNFAVSNYPSMTLGQNYIIQDSEMPQMGYTTITNGPWMDNVGSSPILNMTDPKHSFINNTLNAWMSVPGSQEQSSLYSSFPDTTPDTFSKGSLAIDRGPLCQGRHQYSLSVGTVSDRTDRSHTPVTPQPLTFGPPEFGDLTTETNPSPENYGQKRKRAAFDDDGKRKVKGVRLSGACVSCRVRKIPCNTEDICASCLKAAHGLPIGKQICLRTKLKDIYEPVKAFHASLAARQHRLIPLLTSLIGESSIIRLSVTKETLRGVAELQLRVRGCSSSPLCRWKRLKKVHGIYITEGIIEDKRYVIVPESLPSITEFDNFGRMVLSSSSGSHSGQITRILDEFLVLYSNGHPATRLRRLANCTARIASLNRLVAYGFLNLHDGSFDLLGRLPSAGGTLRRFVSETVQDQLRVLAATGLEDVEALTFSEIDDINKIVIEGSRNHGRMIAGICLLRLMLLYRDRLVRDSIRLKLPRNGKRHQIRLEKAAFMYKRITIAYGALCHERNTPVSMKWAPEVDNNSTGDDTALRELFLQLQPAFDEFCSQKMAVQYDDVLNGLVIERPKKLQAIPKKRRGRIETGGPTTFAAM